MIYSNLELFLKINVNVNIKVVIFVIIKQINNIMKKETFLKKNNLTEGQFLGKDLLPLLEKTNAYGLEKFKKLYHANKEI